LAGKSKSARYSESRTDTLLGAGVRIDGNVSFAGVLRTQGDILGDVSCAADPNGTIVVAKSGNVTGTIKAAHVVVGGRVHGNVDASESIEVQQGACVVGDVSYGNIGIHAGGVVEGALTPRVLVDPDRSGQEPPIPDVQPSAVAERELPVAEAAPQAGNLGQRTANRRKLGVALVLLVAVTAVMLVNRNAAVVTTPVADETFKTNFPVAESPARNAAPVANAVPQDAPKPVAEDAPPLVPGPEADIKTTVVQASPSDAPEINPEQVETVQGDDPRKSANFVFVIANEPSVLMKKKRQDTAEGTRIDVAQDSRKRIAIAGNEILRVAAGQDVDMFYQGHKVARNTTQSGVWMSFVPYSPGASRAKR
jgi:cytoskeletal protein CcmA (bactofilin family)